MEKVLARYLGHGHREQTRLLKLDLHPESRRGAQNMKVVCFAQPPRKIGKIGDGHSFT
jgi:hypothetical protein